MKNNILTNVYYKKNAFYFKILIFFFLSEIFLFFWGDQIISYKKEIYQEKLLNEYSMSQYPIFSKDEIISIESTLTDELGPSKYIDITIRTKEKMIYIYAEVTPHGVGESWTLEEPITHL